MFGRLNCRLTPMCFNRPKVIVNDVQNCVSVALLTHKMSFSSTMNNFAMHDDLEPKKWLKYNDTIFPPQEPGEERRPAYICHQVANIKYSPKKMWYVACFVRGMSVDEAFKQLPLVGRKGATIVRDAILEAQKLAVEKHHVEFKTNLWIAESFCTKGPVVKGIRRHARQRMGEVMYRYCHYFVRLEEGEPPKEYYYSWPKTGPTLLAQWIDEVRGRKIEGSL
ncbi:39S ribosomal protein L22, mitochondrial [Adelges cooleyi]|uniref:39S ribosomal protein L22, mitochondrial n=1 Tax=Adelges cooleyi TaxID=133065 RepID=UPI00217F87E2|nr:39S ribosomal protein L22, mitochondrial [Adelges cooleyi]XP_050442614.1 39S ribosomal protein L22, mitochondrial [Adelges cooleyi]